MAITSPTKIGENSGTSSATNVVTTSVAHNAGDPISVHVVSSTAVVSVSGVADSAGNSYSLAKRTSATTVVTDHWVSSGAIALASGGTVTVTFSGAVNSMCQVLKSGGHGTAKDSEASATAANSGPVTVGITTVATSTIIYATTGLIVPSGGTADTFADAWANYTPFQHPTASLRLIVQSLIKTSAGATTYSDLTVGTGVTRWVVEVVAFAELVPGGVAGMLPLLGSGS